MSLNQYPPNCTIGSILYLVTSKEEKTQFLLTIVSHINIKIFIVFHPLTYEAKLEDYTDPQERKAVEIQVTEYGQAPKQLFKAPHPKRYSKNVDFSGIIFDPEEEEKRKNSDSSIFFSNLSHKKNSIDSYDGKPSETKKAESSGSYALIQPVKKSLSFFEQLSQGLLYKTSEEEPISNCEVLSEREFKKTEKFHKAKVTSMTCLNIKTNKNTISSSVVVGSDNGYIKLFDSASHRSKQLINIGSGLSISALGRTSNQYQVAIATNDFHITIYNTTLAKTITKFHAHEDTVSSIQFTPINNYLITAGMDCTYKFWDPSFKIPISAFYDTDDNIISTDINKYGLYMCLDSTGMLVMRPVNHPKEFKIIHPNKSQYQEYIYSKFSSTSEYQYYMSSSRGLKLFDMRNFREIDCFESSSSISKIVDTPKELICMNSNSVTCYTNPENNMVSGMEVIKKFSIPNPACIEYSEDKNLFVACENGDFYYSMYLNYTFCENDSD